MLKTSSQPRKLHVLFVATRMPSHLMTGDRLREYLLIKGLIDRGHVLDLLGFENTGCPQVETDIYSICRQVHPVPREDLEFMAQSPIQQLKDTLVGARHGLPRRVWQLHSPAMMQALQDMFSRTDYDVIHFSGIGVAELLTQVRDRKCAKVFDLVDAVSMSVRRSLMYRHDLSWPMRALESYQLFRFEKGLLKGVDAGCVVSSRDRAYLGNPPNLEVIPIGIEIPAFSPGADKRFDLMFFGNMSAKMNVDAVHWFVKHAWPLVIAKRPQTTFCIVGANPVPSILALNDKGVVVTGTVDDVDRWFSSARVFVAPLRFGAGQKIKLLRAFAHKLPVVATDVANEGIDGVDGESILVRNSPQEMAQTILDLLGDQQKHRVVGENAYRFLCQNYTWQRSAELLEGLYFRAIDNERSTAAPPS
jgi:glycosyltransferase involved in cell wall biosynthesis